MRDRKQLDGVFLTDRKHRELLRSRLPRAQADIHPARLEPMRFLFIVNLTLLTLGNCLTSVSAQSASQPSVDFNRDVRPILSDRCFLCHGPDQTSEQAQETDLRLDDRDSAIEFEVFDFENVDSSEFLHRVKSVETGYQMPPPESHKKRLTPSEIETIRNWIEQGAEYDRHWAYRPPRRPLIPEIGQAEQRANPIDAFVLHRLEQENLAPALPANRATLIRRASLDLTGLPPTVAEIERFENDPAPLETAFETVIDRLLASPHYGEQMARSWLDAARYADTSGYQYDRERQQWVWRDWVIAAFNSNLPFDQFTIQQIAGDLLPDATDQTRLATGFNRNHPITIEGGVVDEEYRTEYVIDRVVTTSTVWLGQTFLCARCHDHKYDPVSQDDFYRFYAYFNNVPEKGLNGFAPKSKIASPLANDRIASLQQQVENARHELSQLDLPLKEWTRQLQADVPAWTTLTPVSITSSGGADPEPLDDQSILMTGKNADQDDYELTFQLDREVRVIRLEALTHPSLTNGSASRGSNGNFVLTEFVVETFDPESGASQPVRISNATADYEQNGFGISKATDGKLGKTQGWAVDGNTKPENRTAHFQLENPLPAGQQIRIRLLHRYGMSHQIGRFRLSFSDRLPLAADMEQLVKSLAEESPELRSDDQLDQLHLYLIGRFGNDMARTLGDRLTKAKSSLAAARDFPETMVMDELPTPRAAFVLQRGEYDKPLKDRPVQPGIPAALGSIDSTLPANRLGLATWLVSADQPLTARVTVNRFWQKLFGVGLVKTSEDFGSQGEFPSHPELLDWLAVEFMESGWDVKQILKTMMMSKTYQQSSVLSKEAIERDPENRLLARGPRFRLAGEVIRDSALAASGLLKPTVGGPSVYPYHPTGLWLEINNRPNYSREYPHQTDVNQHLRRSLYTFWKRTVTPPSLATFDAPSREYCVVRRSSTNTPLQAFVMMHDPQFVEAAKFLAVRMLNEGGTTLESQIEFGFRLTTARRPSEDERDILRETYADWLERYADDPDAANRLLSVGMVELPAVDDPNQLAAMTQVARMLINLSEFLTKE